MEHKTEIEAGQWIRAEIEGQVVEVRVRDVAGDDIWVFLPARLQGLYDQGGSYTLHPENLR
jgi:hypothetical protein